MSSVTAYEAKTHFSALLARAEQGEQVTITKHGRPVARLVPVAEGPKMSKAEAVRRLREFRETHSLGGITIKELINEGRKR